MGEIFPTDVSYGSRGGPGFMTSIIDLPESGQEQRVARRSQKRHRWNAAYGIKSHADLASVRDFYVAHLGPVVEFRYLDYFDCSTATGFMGIELDGGESPAFDDVVIGVADGSTTTFQAKKIYTFGSLTRALNITKPVAADALVGVNGVNQSSGWSINDETGIITFSVAPTSGDVTWGGRHHWPARFGKEIDELFDMTVSDFSSGGVDVPIIEVLDGGETPEEFFYGGSYSVDPMTADQTISILQGRTCVFKNVDAGLKVSLPAKASIPSGGPLFFIVHGDSSGNDFTLEDSDTSTTIWTATPGDVGEVIMSETSGGVKTWYVI